jgi:hypothetical protein
MFALLGALLFATPALATPPDDSKNDVSDWCETGIKIEPVATPFVVPEGNWSLLVLKAGSGPDQNALFPNPIVGNSYSHPDHDNSHAILCEGSETTTTTVPETTTTTEVTTTTQPEETTTTSEVTTTTQQETTTTTDPSTTTTDPGTTTTQIETTTLPEVSTDIPELPVTGAPLFVYLVAGIMFATLGGLAVWRTQTD